MKSFTASLALLIVFSVASTAETGSSIRGGKNSQPTPKSVAAAPSPSPDEDAAAEDALMESVNRSRQQAGVGPLRMEETLRVAARLHAQRMVDAQRLEHQLPGELALLQRIAEVTSLPLDRAGENIATATCASDAHQLLMNSPPHRENILDTHFNVAGVAAIWSRGHLYVVEDFAHGVESYSSSQAAGLVGEAISELRHSAGLNNLAQLDPPNLDNAACAMAKGDHPNARLIAASYTDRKTVAYTQSSPERLPPAALRVLSDPGLREFAVGSCYARNAAYPTGIYWVAILLY